MESKALFVIFCIKTCCINIALPVSLVPWLLAKYESFVTLVILFVRRVLAIDTPSPPYAHTTVVLSPPS